MNKSDRRMDQSARAAWMYYIAGKTQHEIAAGLGISRQVAQRLVALAAESGLVHVSIKHPIAECTALAEQMSQRFSLSLCQIVPSKGMGSVDINRMIAVAGADVMLKFICREEAQTIAVGSGRTLQAAVKELPEIIRPQHNCVSLIGAIASDGSCTRYDVSLWVAEKTQSKYFILPAPLFADSPADRESWCNHRIYRMVTEKAAEANATFIGIGQIGYQCPLHADGFITTEEVNYLVSSHVVGEILGHYFNAEGIRIPSKLDARLTSVAMKPQPEKAVIALAGGQEKFQAIKSALRGRWINGLVTDEDTANRLLSNES